MRQRSYLFLLLVLALGIISGLIYAQKPYKKGLDIAGGVRFIYQMDLTKLTAEQRGRIEEVRANTQRVLVNRATGSFGVQEPNVVPKGQDQFVIELPGYTDIERAREVIGTSAKIRFYHAKNVKSRTKSWLPYDVSAREGDEPVVNFIRSGSGELIKPGTDAYASVIAAWGDPIVEGDDIASASAQPAGSSYQPLMTFTPKGAEKMEAWSRQNFNSGAQIAAVLDGNVLSVAALQDNTILNSNAVITGEFTAEYVRRLTELISSGSLPVDLKMLSSEKVDPTIGAQALDKILLAGAISFGLIAAFLIAYYSFPGVVALVALLLYVLFTLTALKAIDATFSLAAIAGFILSVGMAVDANVLVFERFKEEMKGGKTLMEAIELGFRRALPAIIDSNACTILTSLVLVNLGTGPVKGFATTLVIGVAISLFTAVFVTRSLLVFLVGSGIGANPKLYAVDRNWFFRKIEERADANPLKIVESSRKWFILSAVSIAVCLPFVFPLGGLKPNVEFQGGYEVQLSLAGKSMTPGQISDTLARQGLRGANVKLGGEGAQRVAIVTVPNEGPLKGLGETEAFSRITQLAGFAPADLKGSSSVGAAIQQETIRNAILGVVLSSALIIVYLALRFGVAVGGFLVGLRFGLSAVGALVHDVLFVLGVSAVTGFLFGWEISALFITSMLTVIGFSVHDTIVIFDRIRENLRRPQPGEDFARLVNRSVSQSFARSFNTSSTVIATLAILLAVGTTTPDLKLFCVTMLAGIVSGTYSSIYNASPILYIWDKAVGLRRGEKDTIVGHARTVREQQSQTPVAGPVGSPISVGAPVAPGTSAPTTGRSYGQVRRRANAVDRSRREIED